MFETLFRTSEHGFLIGRYFRIEVHVVYLIAGAIFVPIGYHSRLGNLAWLVALSLGRSHPAPGRARAEGEGEMIMRSLIVFAAICFSVNAFAQDNPPKAGTKPVKPKEPTGCKFVGTVKGHQAMGW
jgi:hypothetical protein